MQNTVLRYAPEYWDQSEVSLNRQFTLYLHTEEYKQIEYEVKRACVSNNLSIVKIERNQNVHDYGQFILRGQLLMAANPGRNYYKVRRYICLNKHYLKPALEYNLDPRRCGLSSITFNENFHWNANQIIIVVQVLTSNPNVSSINPETSSEYFIDYIVEGYI